MFNLRDGQQCLFLIIEAQSFSAKRVIKGCLVQSCDIKIGKRINKEKKDKNKLRAVVFFIMAVGFFLMEITGDSVDIYTIIRGFVIAGACDITIENVWKN